MPINKNALIRYKTIDKCLQNRHRRWTLNDLIEACSEALYEYEGREVHVSKRTVQLDIQMMRSDKLGYHAPILVYEKKYYTYENPAYALTDIPLRAKDMEVLAETVQMLGQFKDFSLFQELGGIIQRLEDKVYTAKTQQLPIIHLDKNEGLQGLEYLDYLYQAIARKKVLRISYQSFKAREASETVFHPFLLKEYNNRWFLVGKKHQQQAILTFALDRIKAITAEEGIEPIHEPFDGDDYYKDTIGVTVLGKNQVQKILLRIDRANAPYVLTKPFHPSQKLIEKHPDGSIAIQLNVHINYELERLLLGFGNSVEVLAPMPFRKRIKWRHKKALEQYSKGE